MDLFDLSAIVRLDTSQYENALSGIQSSIGTAAKAMGAAITVAAGAVVGFASSAVSAYSNFEQLEGGVKTLFGAQELSLQEYADKLGVSADAAKEKYEGLIASENEVFKNASQAYRTAGLNMNEYMSTATSFAAALKASTGTELEAAKVADVAIQDMSDNANKMGTSMESIQNAYQGFAKQNYAMLDNLKLGRTCRIAQYKPCENGETLMFVA